MKDLDFERCYTEYVKILILIIINGSFLAHSFIALHFLLRLIISVYVMLYGHPVDTVYRIIRVDCIVSVIIFMWCFG